MATLERVFRNHELKEHNWEFHYLTVRASNGEPAAMTFFTTSLAKDDMLMREQVSTAVEARRRDDKYFLTSLVVSMGSGFSEGNHLFVDRGRPWRPAVEMILIRAHQIYEDAQANVLMLRDLPSSDPEMDGFLLKQGFVKIPMFDSHLLDVGWKDETEFLAALSRRKRKHLGEVIEKAKSYTARFWGVRCGALMSDEQAEHLHALYTQVARRKLKLNVFELPSNLVDGLQRCPSWEILTLHLDPSDGGPADGRAVAFYAGHKHGADYAPFFCGLDYDYVFEHGAYRQMILQMVRRAHALGVERIHMGMDADMEKSRFGTRLCGNSVYLQAREHFNGGILRDIVSEVGLGATRGDQG
jgi:hypothetical protein